MSRCETVHIFRAADPDPKPVGWVWWKNRDCRAACSCGWRADTNSGTSGDASRRWSSEHRSLMPQEGTS